MSLNNWHCQGPREPSSCAIFTINSHWAELPQAKKKTCIYAPRVTSGVSSSLQPCRLWPTRLLCQKMGSPGKNTGAYWPILVAIPFQSTIFPAALAANSPEYLVQPEPL